VTIERGKKDQRIQIKFNGMVQRPLKSPEKVDATITVHVSAQALRPGVAATAPQVVRPSADDLPPVQPQTPATRKTAAVPKAAAGGKAPPPNAGSKPAPKGPPPDFSKILILQDFEYDGFMVPNDMKGLIAYTAAQERKFTDAGLPVPPQLPAQRERLRAKLAKLEADVTSGALTGEAVVDMMKRQIQLNLAKMKEFGAGTMPYLSLQARNAAINRDMPDDDD
jgi:hypothetical protein